jgi:hypothetical protein
MVACIFHVFCFEKKNVFAPKALKKNIFKTISPLRKSESLIVPFLLHNPIFRWLKEPVAVPEATLHHHPNPT